MDPGPLSPSLLVFGVLPSFLCPNSQSLNQSELLNSLNTARTGRETIVAERRIRNALKYKLPRSKKYLINPGDQVKFFRETSHKWEGPLTVTKTTRITISITDGEKRVQHHLSPTYSPLRH